MDKNLKLLKIVSLIAGILMIVFYAQRTISHVIFLFRVDFQVGSLLGFTTLIGIAAGILLVKASKKLKFGEKESGLNLMQIGSILLFVLAAFPLYYTITNFEYLGDFEYVASQLKNILIPVAFPIFFFVFRSKLDQTI